jgi:hypothetical protein
MKSLGRIICATLVASYAALPAFALDYEAKPVGWVLLAPFRLAGGLAGGTFCGLVSGPIDNGFHETMKLEKKGAGVFGDERGAAQMAFVAPVAVPVGSTLGGAVGVGKGFKHGFETGWNKPLSRWSFITMEEK